MALLKLIRNSDISPRRPSSKDFLEQYGLPDDSHLAFEIYAEGYPSRDADKKAREAAIWYISQASYVQQKSEPLLLHQDTDMDTVDVESLEGDVSDGHIWFFDGNVYYTDDRQLTADDVRALVNVEKNKRRLILEKAHSLQAMSDNFDKPKRRETIPQTVRLEVWQRDRGRCVECESQEKLEFDHIIPFSMGGSNTSRNLQLLCETCNRRKGASLG